MRAVVLEEKGDPDVLLVRDVPAPEPGPDELLVDLRATALNRADLLQRRGFYPGPPMAHEIPGMEFAGTVVATGARVTDFMVGDEVMGIVAGGAYAEQVVVHERQALPIPPSVGLDDAAAIPEVFLTAFDALVVQAGLTSGRTALVHAGASGVGTAAIQIAKAVGARIIVTTSTDKVQTCRDLGADLAIDYRTIDFVEAVRDATAGHGVDVILDVVGGGYLVRNLDCLKATGTIIQVGVLDPSPVEFPLARMLGLRATLIGTVLRARPLEEKAQLTQRFAAEMLPLFDDATLRPIIDSRFSLDDIAEAHRYMESNANIGKILIDVG